MPSLSATCPLRECSSALPLITTTLGTTYLAFSPALKITAPVHNCGKLRPAAMSRDRAQTRKSMGLGRVIKLSIPSSCAQRLFGRATAGRAAADGSASRPYHFFFVVTLDLD